MQPSKAYFSDYFRIISALFSALILARVNPAQFFIFSHGVI
jgi:hypothetical protein